MTKKTAQTTGEEVGRKTAHATGEPELCKLHQTRTASALLAAHRRIDAPIAIDTTEDQLPPAPGPAGGQSLTDHLASGQLAAAPDHVVTEADTGMSPATLHMAARGMTAPHAAMDRAAQQSPAQPTVRSGHMTGCHLQKWLNSSKPMATSLQPSRSPRSAKRRLPTTATGRRNMTQRIRHIRRPAAPLRKSAHPHQADAPSHGPGTFSSSWA